MMGSCGTRRRIAVGALGASTPTSHPLCGANCDNGRDGARHARERPRSDARRPKHPGVPGRNSGGPQRPRAELPDDVGERLGFARLEIEFGYPIVPFAAVGAEEMLHVVVDRGTPIAAQVSALTADGGCPAPPLPRGIGVHRSREPERLYVPVGEPVDTADRWRGRHAARARFGTRSEPPVLAGIRILLADRARPASRAAGCTWHEAHELPRLAGQRSRRVAGQPRVRGVERHGAAGAAPLSRWVQLSDPPEWPGALPGADVSARSRGSRRSPPSSAPPSAELTEARTIGDRVLAVFELRGASG